MKTLLYTLLIFLTISCAKNEPPTLNIAPEKVTQEIIDSVLTEITFKYETPVIIDSSDYVMIPISASDNTAKRKKINISSYGNEWANTYGYWNVLFLNKKTNKTTLLTDSKMKINSFSANKREQEKFLDSKILYKIIADDYNYDGKLNSQDSENLYISEKNGTGLKRISPKNEDLISYTFMNESNQLLFQTKRDSNADRKFDSKDELIWYTMDFSKNMEYQEVVDSLMRKNIKNLFFEQWVLTQKIDGE